MDAEWAEQAAAAGAACGSGEDEESFVESGRQLSGDECEEQEDVLGGPEAADGALSVDSGWAEQAAAAGAACGPGEDEESVAVPGRHS